MRDYCNGKNCDNEATFRRHAARLLDRELAAAFVRAPEQLVTANLERRRRLLPEFQRREPELCALYARGHLDATLSRKGPDGKKIWFRLNSKLVKLETDFQLALLKHIRDPVVSTPRPRSASTRLAMAMGGHRDAEVQAARSVAIRTTKDPCAVEVATMQARSTLTAPEAVDLYRHLMAARLKTPRPWLDD